MGESNKEVLRVQFDPSVKLEFQGAKMTRDGSLLLFREMDEMMGLTVWAEDVWAKKMSRRWPISAEGGYRKPIVVQRQRN